MFKKRSKNPKKKKIVVANYNVVNKKKTQKGSKNSFIEFLKSKQFRISIGVFTLLLSFLLLFAFSSYITNWEQEDSLFDKGFVNAVFQQDQSSENVVGKIGGWLSYIFIKKLFGYGSFIFIPVLFLISLKLLYVKIKKFNFKIILLLSYIVFFSLFFAALFPKNALTICSGAVGIQMSVYLKNLIGSFGFYILLVFIAVSLISVTFPSFFPTLYQKIKTARAERKLRKEQESSVTPDFSGEEPEANIVEWSSDSKSDANKELGKNKAEETDEFETNEAKKEVPFEIIESESANEDFKSVDNEIPEENESSDVSINDELDELLKDTEPYDPKKDLSEYKLPSDNLLQEHGKNSITIDKGELEANKNRIESTLENYGIKIDRITATVGPTVTLYEIIPAPGIRISKIKNLEDDIALSLAALGIRIIAPIPGKGTIGIEVPNRNPETVSFKSIVTSKQFLETKFDLPIALGKTITNEVFVADLAKMPHLLMAGATGQGKSVGLNAVIASLLFKKHPSELKFVMVDPKKVELPLFSKIERHYLAKLPDEEEAIITDTSQVIKTLKGLTQEMDKRYDLLKDAHVRSIKEYNTKFISRKLNPKEGHKFLPYIVLIIDEFADLIMTAGKEIEAPIGRLAQMARAVGMHLVIATQRPSVNIITGVIKANFPSRIAFRVSSKVDSRTILDSGGADQLVGRGDMLLATGSSVIRLQCAFIDTPELEDITEFIGSQRAYSQAHQLPEVQTDDNEKFKEIDNESKDDMFEEAARIIVANQHGSTSLLQRKLKLGYNRAGRIIDQLEAAGIVGPFEGSKAREVLIKDPDSLEQLLQSLNQ